MRKNSIGAIAATCCALFIIGCQAPQDSYEWQPAGSKILTEWGENLQIGDVHGEYPRPSMARDVWISLNGLWNYSTDHSSGKILVPFCIESALSGVGQTLEPNEKLIYSREYTLKSKDIKGRMLLHAGAIDQEAVIYVNDKEVASHIGGFTAFSADISATVKKGKILSELKLLTIPTMAIWPPVSRQENHKAFGILRYPVFGRRYGLSRFLSPI